MTGPPSRHIQLAAPCKPEVDWTARLALGGAAAFTLLLFAFGLILYQSWPQMSGVHRSIATLADKTERIATGEEVLQRDIASLRGDLREDRTGRAESTREMTVLRSRVNDISTSLATLRAQTDKLESQRNAVVEPSPAPAVSAQADPAIAELRSKLEALQRRLDEAAAVSPSVRAADASPVPSKPLKGDVVAASAPAVPTALPARTTNYTVDEIDREVRDMQRVIAQQQAKGAAQRTASQSPPAPTVTERGVGGNGIADPLAPMTSKTPPRIAPVGPSPQAKVSFTPGASDSASVSRVPSYPTASRREPLVGPGAEARVTRVGVNSAMNAIGPLGLPLDVIGNLFTAIGEGLDRLFTGREYLPRVAPSDEPATARLNR